MDGRRRLVLASLAAVGALGLASAAASDASFAQVARGRYLVYAGDCFACHTAEGGAPFAGGRPVPTPFGTIYATNLTPDRQTGIGRWSDADFWKAMHDGIRPDGKHLYPAFPYPWYTKLDQQDVRAIKAYLDTLPAVRSEAKAPKLPWPLSWRESVAGWNLLYFRSGEYRPHADKSSEWNRGAYLVEGLGHCGACHSPKNVLGGVKRDERYHGGMGEGWFATSLTKDSHEGLGAWTVEDIVDYLKTGANEHARALGPMAEVVENSTRYLDAADLRAMAVYLKDMPGDSGKMPSHSASDDHDALSSGRLVYVDQCAGCHMEDGAGIAHVFPVIQGNSGSHASNPASLIRLVLEGAHSAKSKERPEAFAMPAFDWKLSDREIADVLTYVRASWGNDAPAVAPAKVAAVRKAIRKEEVHGS